MLQVKDPQEVFDENIRPLMKEIADETGQELVDEMLNTPYSIFVLGEMYGTISTCLAQNIPIPKELWDMPVIQSMVRGDVDDVVVVESDHKEQGFYQSHLDNPQVDTTKPVKLVDGRGFYLTT